MAAALKFDTPLILSSKKPKTIAKTNYKLKKIIPSTPSQIMVLTQPQMKHEEFLNYTIEVTEKNYDNMVKHKEQIVENLDLFVLKYQAKKAQIEVLKKQNKIKDDLIKQLNQKLARNKAKAKKLVKAPEEPKWVCLSKNPQWKNETIVLNLEDSDNISQEY